MEQEVHPYFSYQQEIKGWAYISHKAPWREGVAVCLHISQGVTLCLCLPLVKTIQKAQLSYYKWLRVSCRFHLICNDFEEIIRK